MRRRDFIAGIGSTAAWPVVARGQQNALRRIGYLGATSLNESAADVAAFQEGLAATSHFALSSVAIEFRWAEGRYERLPTLVTDLIDRQVAVLVTSGSFPPALAAKAATQTIPIVFVMGADPVATGLVANLQRPGQNITGATSLAGELIEKRLELLHDFLPTVTLVAFLFNPNNPAYTTAALDGVQKAASALGLRLQDIKASTESDLETAFATMLEQPVGALLVAPDNFFNDHADQLVGLAAHHHIPASYSRSTFVKAGGLISYGAIVDDTYRTAGNYVGRVLSGEKPGDLPIAQPTKFNLAINLGTAKALGLRVPPALLARADEVIE